jgi:uncharacterized protein
MIMGFFAGFIDAIAGGGGLIILPSLLTAGMPPALALGTNKLIGAMGEFSAVLQYLRHQRVDYRRMALGFVFVLIGSSLGAITVQFIHPRYLEKMIPFLLLIVLAYVLLAQKPRKQTKPLMNEKVFFTVFGFFIGFYNGFFGPGTGTIWTAVLMFFISFDIRSAIIYTKPINLVGNLIALLWFIIGGHVDYSVAIVGGVGTFIGGRAGARFVMFKEVRLIKWLFVVFVLFMTIGLFIKYYG